MIWELDISKYSKELFSTRGNFQANAICETAFYESLVTHLIFFIEYFTKNVIFHIKSHIRDTSSITSAKKWVGGVRKWQFLLIYSTIYADVGGWVGLKKLEYLNGP